MADVRCPMCSKLNPAERDTCQYCDARLKPLIAPQGGSLPSPNAEPPDWLSGLRSADRNDFGANQEPDSETEATDWLARLGSSQPSEESELQDESEEEANLPDWFKDLGPGEKSEPKSTYSSEGAPTEDWFTGSQGEVELPDFFTSQPESQTATGDTSAESFDTSTFGTGEMSASEEASATDWLTNSPGGSATQDWFSSQHGEQAQESELAAEVPDFSASSTKDSEASEEAPSLDWFSTTPEDSSKLAPAEPFDASVFGTSSLDDWSGEQEKEGLPDWLTSTGSIDSTNEAMEPESSVGDPDWLMRVRARQQAEQQFEVLSEPAEETEEEGQAAELPDWLSSFSEPGEASLKPITSPAAEWEKQPPVISPFTNLEQEEGEQAFDWSAGGLGEPARPTAAPFIREEVDESPDWLKSLTQESQTPTGQAEASAPAAPLFPADQAAPNWLSTLGSASEQVPGITVPAFVTDEQGELGGEVAEPFIAPESDEYLSSTPDWLSQVTADDAVTASQAQSEGETEEIARADLPTWLEAMRPVEAVAPEMFKDMSDSRVESVGPLAGLRGTLPAELDIKDTLKPPPYSLKLAVPDDLQARLDVLKSLLEAETQATPVSSQVVFSPQILLRLVVFAGFLVAVIWALWAGPLPSTQLSIAQAPQQILDFQDQIAALQPGTAVLVAVDYDPGYIAELETSLEAVFQHLADQNSPIFTLSSSTSGTIQAERILAKINATPRRVQNPYTGLVNLGYLPGGPAGLLAFAASPNKVIPIAIQGQGRWADSLPSPEGGLENFGAVIVATERAETARAWIEQIGPVLQRKGVALLMVTSAQCEPVIRSYYTTSPQLVNGFISGLMGGAVYENLLGQFGAASTALDGYSATVLIAVITILLGGLINFLAGVLPQSRTNTAVEEKA